MVVRHPLPTQAHSNGDESPSSQTSALFNVSMHLRDALEWIYLAKHLGLEKGVGAPVIL